MKRFTSWKIYVLMLLLSSTLVSKAQIKIISSDFEPGLQIGKTYTTFLDRTTTQVNIGSPGATSWDFTGLVASNEFVTESKTVGTSPYAADFTGAEYASNYEGIFDGNYSNSWVYSSFSTTSYLTHGTGTVANTSAGNLTTKIKYTPAWEQYAFPVEYGNTHTYSGTQTVTSIVTVPGFGDFPTTINQTVTVTQLVDAYGIVKMPDGKRLNALRIKQTTTFNNNGSISSSVVYNILTKTGELVGITPSDPNATSGLVAISSLSWSTGRGESLPEETATVADPTQLMATAGENFISLSWIDNADNETGYKVERKTDGGDFSLIATLDANATLYTDNSAEAGVTYIYRLIAFNADAMSGYSSNASAMIEVQVVTVADPSELMATVSESTIILSWIDNADNETGYKLERKTDGGDFSVIATLDANAISYTDNSAEAGVTYIYRVMAFNAEVMSGYSSTASVMIEIPVITVTDPSGLMATADESSITLSWTDNADNETGYKVERKTDGGDFSVIATLDANAISYTDNSAEAGITYIYRVMAFNAEVMSGYSSTASVMIEIPVITVTDPSGLMATAGENSISLSWTDNADNETGYKVERKTDGADFSVIATLDANATSYTDNSAEAGITYIYRVMAFNAEVMSGYSSTASAMILVTGIFDQKLTVEGLSNYPNPFSGKTTINFTLSKSEFVTVKVLNLEGREIETLFSGNLSVGHHWVSFDGSALNNGIYFYLVKSSTTSQMNKMIVKK